MRKLYALVLCLSLIACQTAPLAPQSPASNKLTAADIKPAVKDAATRNAWQNFIFDVQVVADHQLLPQSASRFAKPDPNPLRTLRTSGSIGRSNNRVNIQTNTGLWPVLELDNARAKLWIDFDWPRDLGEMPDEFTDAHLSARIDCEPWAQALAANQSGRVNYPALKKALEMEFKDTPVDTDMPHAPYKIDDVWIIPVVITLKSTSFTDMCL